MAASSAPNHWTRSSSLASKLQPLLSSGATIDQDVANAPRWSGFGAPRATHVVNVATEKDVAAVVDYCIKNDLQFLAQSGGHGWADTFSLKKRDVIINLRKLNTVTVASDKQSAVVGGGALIGELVDATYNADVRVQAGSCNCVGALGSALGGGMGRTMGLYGLGVDNVLSVNLVNAKGQLKTITSKDKDLWWAIRGAGPNFGIITSAKLRSYPVPKTQNIIWQGSLVFQPTQLDALATAFNNLVHNENMAIYMYFATGGPPDFKPAVIVAPYYIGTAEEGKNAFKSIYDIGPVAETTGETPFNLANEIGTPFCVKGGRKPSFGAGLGKLDGPALKQIWDVYVEFLKTPGTGGSTVLMEQYATDKMKSFGSASSAYPFRDTVRVHAVAIAWYEDPALDAVAVKFAKKVREIWRATDGLEKNSTYINFAGGDEPLEGTYGSNVARLLEIKRKADPRNVFNQWFPLIR